MKQDIRFFLTSTRTILYIYIDLTISYWPVHLLLQLLVMHEFHILDNLFPSSFQFFLVLMHFSLLFIEITCSSSLLFPIETNKQNWNVYSILMKLCVIERREFISLQTYFVLTPLHVPLFYFGFKLLHWLRPMFWNL